MDKNTLEKELCRQLCADIKLVERKNGCWMVSAPFFYPDGDHYSIYLREMGEGVFRLSDGANTVMKLSYETPDVEKYFRGGRGEIVSQIRRENGIEENDGDFYTDISVEEFARGIFRLSQALSQIYDLSYLNRDRAASTFYRDLEDLLKAMVENLSVSYQKGYALPNMENADNYRVDYSFMREDNPFLFLFGIPTANKAKLVTITLQHFLLKNQKTPTVLVFEDQAQLPSGHLSRLMDANIGGSLVSNITSEESIRQNLVRHIN